MAASDLSALLLKRCLLCMCELLLLRLATELVKLLLNSRKATSGARSCSHAAGAWQDKIREAQSKQELGEARK